MKNIKGILGIALSLLLAVPPNALAEAVGAITYIEGRVDRLSEGTEGYFPLVVGDKISTDDVIRTKSYSKAEITFEDGSVVRLAPNTQIGVKEYEIGENTERKKAVIGLDRGRIRATVSKTKDNARFDINTPNALGSVKGSDIFMSYHESATSILVADGVMQTINPVFPSEIINVKEGSASFVPHNAPPKEPRLYLPMEKERYESETGPVIKGIRAIEKPAEEIKAMVRKVAGAVKVQPSGSNASHSAIINEALNPGDKVETGKNGRVEMSLDNGHILELGPNTQIIIKTLKQNTKTGDYENAFECNFGELIAKLKKVEGKSSFTVKTPNATCGVRGTIMYLLILPNLTRVFFEGGEGTITSLISGITKIVGAEQNNYADNEGNVSDPADTTDEEKDNFGSGFGDEDDEYGYTPSDGEVGDDLSGADFGEGGPKAPGGEGEGSFDEVPQGPGTTGGPGGGGGTTILPTPEGLTGDFEGVFGYYSSFGEDEESYISATFTSPAITAPWSGTSAVDITGTYFNPNERSLWFGDLEGEGSDGGAFIGWAGGSSYASWEGIISALYIDPSGVAGIMFGAAEGTNDDLTGTLSGSGDVSFTPVTETDILPAELPGSIETNYDMPGEFIGIFDHIGGDFEEPNEENVGYLEGEFSLNTMNLEGEEEWGIWEGIFSLAYNNPRPLETWRGGLFATFGEDFEEGDFLFGLIEGTDTLDGSLNMDMVLFYLDGYSLGVLGGLIFGAYEPFESYYYEGIGLGTYASSPLTFSGLWGEEERSLYYNNEGDIEWAGEDYGFIGSDASPWLGPADFVARGEYRSNEGFGPFIWNTPIYSFNYNDNKYTTYDGGAFFGFTGGIWNNFTMDGAAVALYFDPDGNAGFLKGDVSGFYLPFSDEEGIWGAVGSLTPTQMATGLEINPENLEDYINDGYLKAHVAGDFDGDGFIEGWSDWGDTFFIHDRENNIGYRWGIYDIKLGDENWYYKPEGEEEGSTNWSAMTGGEGEFGAYYYGEEEWDYDWGFWLADMDGTAENEEIKGDLLGKYITYTQLGTIEGDIFGLYNEEEEGYGYWIAESLGTWIGKPLTFSGKWEGDSLYYNKQGDPKEAGNEYGLLGSIIENWWSLKSFPILAVGEYEVDKPEPLIWNSFIYSYNVIKDDDTTLDGGAFYGFTGGIWNNEEMNGSIAAIYMDPDGNAGILRGDVDGNYYPYLEMWMVEGLLTPTQMASASNLGIDPKELDEYIDWGDLDAYVNGFFGDEEGYIEGWDDWGDTLFLHSNIDGATTSQTWGVYDLKLMGSDSYYNPDPENLTTWSAVIGGGGEFGYIYGEYDDYDEGYWLADIEGIWQDNEIKGDLLGKYITYTQLGTIEGDIFGLYNEEEEGYGYWIAESLGTWQGEALDFGGEVDGSLLYFDGRRFDSEGWSGGLLGGIGDLWSGEVVPVTFMGEYELDNGDEMPYLWFGSGWYIYSYNTHTGERTTFDGGAFYGFAGGSWANGVMDGRARALFITPGEGPTWNAGILYCGYDSAINGEYYPGIEMWQAEGDFTAEFMGVTELAPEDLVFGGRREINWDSFSGEGTGVFGGGGRLEGICDEGTFLNIYDQSWGIWNAGFGGDYEGPTSPFTFAVGGSSRDDKYFLATINGEWESGGISGLFRGVFMEEGENNIAAGSMTGEVVGNYVELDETWQAVGVGEWVELTELDPEIIGFDLAALSDFVEIPITETYASLLAGTGAFDAGGAISGEAVLSVYDDEIWTALITGTYSGTTSNSWSLDLANGGDDVTLTGDLWSDGEWHALVDGAVNGGAISGEAGGIYEDGEFFGVGAGTYEPGE